LFAEQLSAGQIENVSHQMLTEKLWEDILSYRFMKAFQSDSLLYRPIMKISKGRSLAI
jgi:hypothetical protein